MRRRPGAERIPAPDRHQRSEEPEDGGQDPARRARQRVLRAGRSHHCYRERTELRVLLSLLQRRRRGQRQDCRLQLLRGRVAVLRHQQPGFREGGGVREAARPRHQGASRLPIREQLPGGPADGTTPALPQRVRGNLGGRFRHAVSIDHWDAEQGFQPVEHVGRQR